MIIKANYVCYAVLPPLAYAVWCAASLSLDPVPNKVHPIFKDGFGEVIAKRSLPPTAEPTWQRGGGGTNKVGLGS